MIYKKREGEFNEKTDGICNENKKKIKHLSTWISLNHVDLIYGFTT
jgi:hypothetical protein